ncbi:MAG: hypothetical protein IJ637_05535 [Prevotella sp.]|nr:hypothetical protein [Prevotella sp.]
MKRISTSFALLSLLATSALAQQPVQFYYHGEPLADGATVTIQAAANEWGELACETNPPANPSGGLVLKNLTGADITGTSTLTITSRTMAPQLVQWCMGGLCVAIPGDSFDKEFTVPANGQIMVQLDATPTQYGELVARISVMANLRQLSVDVRFVYADPDAKPAFVRRSVVEEYTGTWCGNCPRGIVGLQRLQEQFGDRCIPIAVHTSTANNEPMMITAYPELQPGSGIPACAIDRGEKLDPYRGSSTSPHYGIGNDFAARLAEPTEAGLELTAQWADDMQWDVRFTATTTFGIDLATAPYRLAFVLLEDGMKGEGQQWAQVNYFSTAAGYDDGKTYLDDDLKEWRDAPYYVGGVEYNHVPVNTLGIKTGIQGSISAPIVAYQPQTYTNTVTTLNVKVIQDKNRLSAVAMLINTETGRIVNAAKADIQPHDAAAIVPAGFSAAPASGLRDLQGRRVATPRSGLYITNGKKVIIK